MPRLTDRKVQELTAKKGHMDISDEGTPLTLRVKMNGEKTWIWRGRISNKQTKRIIGTYPSMTLFEARLEAMRLKGDAKSAPATLAPVIHPHHRAVGKTVAEAIAVYKVDKLADLRSGKDVESNLRRFVIPPIGKKLLKDVQRQDVRDILITAQQTMKGAGVNRLLAHIKTFLTYCVQNDFIEVNPALSIVKPAKENVRLRVITPDEFKYVKLPHHVSWSIGRH